MTVLASARPRASHHGDRNDFVVLVRRCWTRPDRHRYEIEAVEPVFDLMCQIDVAE